MEAAKFHPTQISVTILPQWHFIRLWYLNQQNCPLTVLDDDDDDGFLFLGLLGKEAEGRFKFQSC